MVILLFRDEVQRKAERTLDFPMCPCFQANNHNYYCTMQSWEAIPTDRAHFTPDITPLILAAHTDNYEVIKILLDRGAVLPMPHDVRQGFSSQRSTSVHCKKRFAIFRPQPGDVTYQIISGGNT
jgi:hypothetical protein